MSRDNVNYSIRSGLRAALAATLLTSAAGGVLALVPGTVMAQAQTGTVGGQVIDRVKGQPLSGVSVRVVETGRRFITDTDGRFRTTSLAPGEYTLEFSFVGIEPVFETVQVTSGAEIALEIQLGQVETVVVVGQRGAQAQALSEQRAADNLRNVVSADQAGRFPDLNVAESLRRVPGVSIQREEKGGEGRYVSIRGLDSGLNNFQINGMNVAQPEEETRRAPLDVVQTSALSKITVNKTLLPDHESDGIGGQIILETATAFDYSGPVYELEVGGYYQDFAETVGPRIAGTLARKFGAQEQFGILVSGSYSQRDSFGYVLSNGEDYIPLVEDDPSSGFTAYEFELNTFDNDRENLALQAAFDWQATPNTYLALKGSYNRLIDIENNRGLVFEAADEYGDSGNLLFDQGGTVVLYGEYEETEWEQNSLVFQGETYSGPFLFEYGLGYAYARQDEPNDHEVTFETDVDSSLLDYSGSSPKYPFPSLTAGELQQIDDPANFFLGGNDIDADESENTRYSARFDTTYAPLGAGALQFIKGGAKIERSEKRLFEANVLEVEGPLSLSDFGVGPRINFSDIGAPYPAYLTVGTPNLKNWRAFGTNLVASDPAFVNAYAEDGVNGVPFPDEDTYDATEDTYAAYAMGKWVVGRWDFIGGARVDHTKIESNNLELLELEGQDPVLTPTRGSADYTHVLPRFQANLRYADDIIFRAAAFTSIGRPAFEYVSGTTEIEAEDGVVDIFVGNPDLKPSYAYNFDLGVEKYFGNVGVASMNLFYKRIEDFIFNEDAPEAEIDSGRFANDPRLAGLEIDEVVTIINGDLAEIWGAEFNLVRQFSELPGAWGGLGLYANLTIQTSTADSGLEGRDDEDFFNAPDLLYTLATTYQHAGLEATLAYSYRDTYVLEFADFGRNIVAEPYGSLDAQVSYDFGQRVKVFLNAIDLLDDGSDPINDFRFGKGSPFLQEATYNGRAFVFGVNVVF